MYVIVTYVCSRGACIDLDQAIQQNAPNNKVTSDVDFRVDSFGERPLHPSHQWRSSRTNRIVLQSSMTRLGYRSRETTSLDALGLVLWSIKVVDFPHNLPTTSRPLVLLGLRQANF